MPEEIRQLHVSLAAAEAEITRLRELLATVGRLHATGEQHLADLLASESALATSQAETKEGQADLLASELANKTMILANALLLAGKEALRKSEDRFRRLFEATPIALVMINAAGQIAMVNAQTERLFGYTRPELLGASVEILLPGKMHARHLGLRAGFFADPISRPMGAGRSLFGMKKDGSEMELEIGLSPIETDDGMMVLSTIVDISARVRMEEQVRQSQRMHAMGRVTAGVAHDFNNLLLALGGSLELMLDAATDLPEVVEWGQIALHATKRGKQLTDRLLSFSRQQVLLARPIIIDGLFSELKELILNPAVGRSRCR
jgi:PAS domain S-box-containing protein